MRFCDMAQAGSRSVGSCHGQRPLPTIGKNWNGEYHSDGIRLTQQECHPERSKGALREILRCAQNDNTEWAGRNVYEFHAV